MAWAGLIGTALALLAAAPAAADGSPAAVGRISYGATTKPGDAICTGVLVASDLVLTAAHCVRDAADTPDSIRFEAGWSGGSATGRRKGASVILSGAVDLAGLAGLSGDVALVVLDEGFPTDTFPPLPLNAPETGPFTLIAFDRGAPDRPQGPALCRPLARPPGLMALDCPVVSGNSGAPLMQRDGDGWEVVAVMVASAEGWPVRSWAVLPPATLRLRIPVADRTSEQD